MVDKWLIIRNPKNADILNKWENKKYKTQNAFLKNDSIFFSDRSFKSTTSKDNNLYLGYREIFIDEFLRITQKKEDTYEIW